MNGQALLLGFLSLSAALAGSACISQDETASGAANVELRGIYRATAAGGGALALMEDDHYLRMRFDDEACENQSCSESGTFVFDRAKSALTLTDDATHRARTLPIEVLATTARQTSGGDLEPRVLSGQEGLVSPGATLVEGQGGVPTSVRIDGNTLVLTGSALLLDPAHVSATQDNDGCLLLRAWLSDTPPPYSAVEFTFDGKPLPGNALGAASDPMLCNLKGQHTISATVRVGPERRIATTSIALDCDGNPTDRAAAWAGYEHEIAAKVRISLAAQLEARNLSPRRKQEVQTLINALSTANFYGRMAELDAASGSQWKQMVNTQDTFKAAERDYTTQVDREYSVKMRNTLHAALALLTMNESPSTATTFDEFVKLHTTAFRENGGWFTNFDITLGGALDIVKAALDAGMFKYAFTLVSAANQEHIPTKLAAYLVGSKSTNLRLPPISGEPNESCRRSRN